jgi:hypothetical protein
MIALIRNPPKNLHLYRLAIIGEDNKLGGTHLPRARARGHSILTKQNKIRSKRGTWGTSMTPTVMPAARSAWKSSFHLYLRIHATHGRAISVHSRGPMARAFPSAARHHDGEEEVDPRDAVSCGYRSGMTLTDLPPPEMAEASSPELLDAYVDLSI